MALVRMLTSAQTLFNVPEFALRTERGDPILLEGGGDFLETEDAT